MKKSIVLSILLSLNLIGYTQNDFQKSDVKTIDEEYEFLNEHYTKENNFELLDGYELKSFGVFNYEKYSCESKFLVESKTKNVKALLYIITKEKENEDKVRYLCLPINNEKLFKKFIKKSEKVGLTMNEMLNYFSELMISSHLEQQYNLNNKDIKTTEEEYEFLTKKYSNLNNNYLLNGYELKPFTEETIEEKYIYNYKLLVELNTKNVKAVLITITKLKSGDNKIKYLCMPINNKELNKNYVKASIKLGVNLGYYFALSNFSIVSKILDNRYNVK
jgi:hypothetical protein